MISTRIKHLKSPRPGLAPLAAAAAALALIALPAAAQTPNPNTNPSAGQPAARGSAPATPAQTGTAAAGRDNASALAEQEREWIDDMAHAHIAEVETGKLALEKTQNPQVRQFAQQMIDDHTKGLQELRTLAQKKNVQVPDDTDFAHKAVATALRLLSGDLFDSQYIRQVGVNDHRRTLELVQRVSRESRDQDLRALAGKSAPMIQHHLKMAQQLHNQRDNQAGAQREGQAGSDGSQAVLRRDGQGSTQGGPPAGTQGAPQR